MEGPACKFSIQKIYINGGMILALRLQARGPVQCSRLHRGSTQ